MAITVIATGGRGASGATDVTTLAADTRGANCLVVGISTQFIGALGISDSKSNTWTALTQRDNGSLFSCRLFYCLNPTTDAAHTFSSVGGDFASIAFLALSGVASFDQQSGAVFPGPVGSITPAGDGAILVTTASGSATGIGITAGFTIGTAVEYLGANHLSGGIAYLIQTTAAAANPTWTPDVDWKASAMASFLPTPSTAVGADAMNYYLRNVATGVH